MANGKTLKEQVAYLRAQNEAQTANIHGIHKKLDVFIDDHKRHEIESNKYREQQATNTNDIHTIKAESLPLMRKAIYALYGLAGSAFLLIIAAVVKNLLK